MTDLSFMKSITRPVFELVLASFFWGWGFIANKWLLPYLNFAQITLLRFLLCFLICIPFFIRQKPWHYFKLSFFPGFFLGLTILTQTAGLIWTSATKSAFITSLYVVIVPVINKIILSIPLPKLHGVFLAIALIGSGLLNHSSQDLFSIQELFSGYGIGELLTLASAVFSSLQIISISLLSRQIENAFIFNIWSSLWTSLSALPLVFIFPQSSIKVLWQNQQALVAILSLTLLSTIVAFSLQVRNQKKVNSNLASLIYLLESPFAFILAYFFLDESVTFWQGFGMILILVSVILANIKIELN